MKRVKKHRIKSEKPETSTSYERAKDDFDLAYYIHDRVELMHQVFSVLKHKDIKAMTPECVLHVSIDDLQELCTEELLGISSKRLCAILDGAEPPSDTESSSSQSPERLETISLDSISSDDEILSQSSSKKSKKRKHKHGSKSKKAKSKEESGEVRASRAGLTVLELLELQARARAIRAQLQQDQQHKVQEAVAESSHRDSDHDDGDVEIKEEPAEVVEISSDEDKPKVERISPDVNSAKQAEKVSENQTVTKKINDLIITVPQTKQTRKIKLNRNKAAATVTNDDKSAEGNVTTVNKTAVVAKEVTQATVKPKEPVHPTKTSKTAAEEEVVKEKQKKKNKKKDKKKDNAKEGSDHDEITLQLSDTEKMDLLEDLDRKNFDKLSSSSSEDSEDSSSESDSDAKDDKKEDEKILKNKVVTANTEEEEPQKATVVESSVENQISEVDLAVNAERKEHEGNNSEIETTITKDVEKNIEKDKSDDSLTLSKNINEESCTGKKPLQDTDTINDDQENNLDKELVVSSVNDIPVVVSESTSDNKETSNINETVEDITVKEKTPENVIIHESNVDQNAADTNKASISEAVEEPLTEETKDLSEGELSERASSEIEAMDLQPEVVCISDDETDKKRQKKKKKKEKKSKKEKKEKKSKSDFRESGDQNFYKESDKDNTNVNSTDVQDGDIVKIDDASDNYDDVYEILELSDDSSCYEVEGTVLSKEPTAEEIEALSAKIDQIEREDVVTEEDIREHEMREAEKTGESIPDENLENISWKDRYLESKKVKKVLSTSSIFNALRKKNKELKWKLEEAKKKEEAKATEKEDPPAKNTEVIVEGTIEHFNTLQGSTKYVDPVREEPIDKPEDTTKDETAINKEDNEQSSQVTREMKKDAKQLLKMYKRLLKYNDITKQRDPSKKKKKKKAKKKSKEPSSVSGENSSV